MSKEIKQEEKELVVELFLPPLPCKIDKSKLVKRFRIDRISKPRQKIYQLTEGGQAEKLGIKPGDIIIQYDGKKITTLESLRTVKSKTRNKKIKLVISRNGKALTFMIDPGPIGVYLATVYSTDG